jgi:hypothetical protein
MKKLYAFFLLTLPVTAIAQVSDLDLYALAVFEIKGSFAYERYAGEDKNKLQVMPQIIPLSEMGAPFFEELLRETGTDYRLEENSGSIKRNRALSDLSDVNKSEVKLYFSRIDDGTFMAELVYGEAKHRDWDKARLYGKSVKFLLIHSENKVMILDSSREEN